MATDTQRKVVTVDEERHRRIRIEAARRGVLNKDLLEMMIDFTLPKLESGELDIETPRIAAAPAATAKKKAQPAKR